VENHLSGVFKTVPFRFFSFHCNAQIILYSCGKQLQVNVDKQSEFHQDNSRVELTSKFNPASYVLQLYVHKSKFYFEAGILHRAFCQ